jgi:drug/metabolite transporter (DMT)-like permease
MDISYIYLTLFVLLQSITPIFIKKQKKYLLINTFITVVVIFVSMSLYYYYKKKDASYITKFDIQSLYPGFLTQITTLLLLYSLTILPSYIAIPLSSLGIIFISMFDIIINKTVYTSIKYIQMLLLLLGICIINYKIIFIRKQKIEYNPLGIVLIVISCIITGYMYTFLRDNTIKEKDSSKTIILQYKGSLLFLLLFFGINILLGKKIDIPSTKYIIMFTIFVLCIMSPLTYLNTGAIAKLPQLQSAIFSNISIIISLIISVLYFKEKINVVQFVGIIIICFSIFLSMFEKYIKDFMMY